MRRKGSWFGLLLVVALLVSACGTVTSTPEAVTDNDQSTMETSGAMVSQDEASSVMGAGEEMFDDKDGTVEGDASIAQDDMMKGEAGVGEGEASMVGEDEMMEGEADVLDGDGLAQPSDTMGSEDHTMGDDASMAGDGDMMEGEAETSDHDGRDDDAMDKEPMMDLPTWFSAELVDVNSGETLTVAGLRDKVVLVETMAIWCSNCLRQQQEVKKLHEMLGERDDLVTLVLDVDPNEDAGNLKDYAAKHGFTWNYVVAPREVAREIGQLYGDQFLNPPSTPMLIIDPSGEVHLLPFGRKTADDLQEALVPFLNGEM